MCERNIGQVHSVVAVVGVHDKFCRDGLLGEGEYRAFNILKESEILSLDTCAGQGSDFR